MGITHDPRVAAPEIGDALAGSVDKTTNTKRFLSSLNGRRRFPGLYQPHLPVCCSDGPAAGIESNTAFAWTMKSSFVRKSVSLSMTMPSPPASGSLRGKVPEQGEVLAEEGAYSEPEPRRDEAEKIVGLSERADGEFGGPPTASGSCPLLLIETRCQSAFKPASWLACAPSQPLQVVVALAACLFGSALSASGRGWQGRRVGSGPTAERADGGEGEFTEMWRRGRRRGENGQRRY